MVEGGGFNSRLRDPGEHSPTGRTRVCALTDRESRCKNLHKPGRIFPTLGTVNLPWLGQRDPGDEFRHIAFFVYRLPLFAHFRDFERDYFSANRALE